jgi:hypothetical protein
MADYQDIKSDYNEFWRYGQSNWSQHWEISNQALRGYAGDTCEDWIKRRYKQQYRDLRQYNIIKPIINLFSGYARDNIKSTVIGPQEEQDQEVADMRSEVLQFVYNKANAIQTLLNGFDDSLKVGNSLVGIWMDYSEDAVSGDIKFYKRAFNSFLIDPNWSAMDFSDVSEVLLRDFVTRSEAKIMLPFVEQEAIDYAQSFVADDKFNLLKRRRTQFAQRDLLAVDSYYRKTSSKCKKIVDVETGAQFEVPRDTKDKELREWIKFQASQGQRLKEIEVWKPSVELNILLSGEVVYSGADPTGLDEYPFVAIPCFFEPQLDDFTLKLQGIGQGLLDIQQAFNKRHIRIEQLMDQLINRGFIYKPSVIVDQADVLGAGFHNIPVSNNANIGADIREINQGGLEAGWLEYTEMLRKLAMEIAGTNESLFGTDQGGNSQVSGRLAEVRASNGLRANRSIFDNFEFAQRQLGRKVDKAIVLNYTKEKVSRILGVNMQESEEKLEAFFDPNFSKYDASVKQAVLSQTQRDAYYFELIRLIELFGPDPILKEAAIDALPMTGKSRLKEKFAQAAEMEQMNAQVAEQDAARMRALQNSKIEENLALAQERRARVVSDIALGRERLSQVEDNRAGASLDRAKALVELEKLSDDRLINLLTFMKAMEKGDQMEDEEAIERDIERSERFKGQTQLPEAISENLTPNQGG